MIYSIVGLTDVKNSLIENTWIFDFIWRYIAIYREKERERKREKERERERERGEREKKYRIFRIHII